MNLENIVLSPTFTIILGVIALYLFVILTREFCQWYFKINHLQSKLEDIDTKLSEIINQLEKPSRPQAVILPPLPQIVEAPREKFPLSN